jgi:RNA polymerase sigma factor (sigma-70 family)
MEPRQPGRCLVSEHDSLGGLERACRDAADQVIARYGWHLLDRDDLAGRACDLIHAGGATMPFAAAVGAYCVALHTACAGEQGLARQDQGYHDLSRYLLGLARTRYADLPADAREDVAQSALERIYKSFEHCREPVAFLAFAAQHLLDAARVARRSVRRPVDSFERVFGAPDAPPTEPAAASELAPDAQVFAGERRAGLDQWLRELLAAHPRATQQVEILRLSLAEELDDAEIAQRLGTSLNSVWAARSRIIKTIQAEPRWRARAVELGILPGEV